jgi:hypothetical protein
MNAMTKLWKKGRGRLGFLDPLLGRWRAKTVSENGPVECERLFEPVLKENYVRLTAHWKVGPAPKSKPAGKGEARNEVRAGSSYTYDEVALIGGDKPVKFWSFTSDGKHTEGVAADASDLHPEAIGFEAMVMGRQARQVYFPAENGDVIWVVEGKAKKGWSRFVEHRYRRIGAAGAAEAAKKPDEKAKKETAPKDTAAKRSEEKPKPAEAKSK